MKYFLIALMLFGYGQAQTSHCCNTMEAYGNEYYFLNQCVKCGTWYTDAPDSITAVNVLPVGMRVNFRWTSSLNITRGECYLVVQPYKWTHADSMSIIFRRDTAADGLITCYNKEDSRIRIYFIDPPKKPFHINSISNCPPGKKYSHYVNTKKKGIKAQLVMNGPTQMTFSAVTMDSSILRITSGGSGLTWTQLRNSDTPYGYFTVWDTIFSKYGYTTPWTRYEFYPWYIKFGWFVYGFIVGVITIYLCRKNILSMKWKIILVLINLSVIGFVLWFLSKYHSQ